VELKIDHLAVNAFHAAASLAEMEGGNFAGKHGQRSWFPPKYKMKLTLGCVVNGGRRHAGQQEELILCSHVSTV
jgi:hypothetical protein